MAKVVAVNISEKKGIVKHPIEKGIFRINHGLEGDAHAGAGDRQVSFLSSESIEKIKASGIQGLCSGKFVENITTEGICLYKLQIGARFKAGEVTFEVTKVGKECYLGCAIRNQVGDCVMPREIIFAKVLTEGYIKAGDEIVEEG